MRALITTVPFGAEDHRPIDLLKNAGIEYEVNPLGRKLKDGELAEMIPGFDLLIAGTERIDSEVLLCAERLKLISRVGIGLDSIDLIEARRLGIEVSYTPDGPSPAVAELTIGLMLSLLRSIHISNVSMHDGEWHRFFGRRISEIVIGIVGFGRIGKRVLNHLTGFGCKQILVNDIDTTKFHGIALGANVEQVEKGQLFRAADLISLHVPLTKTTRNMITWRELSQMQPGSMIVNTSRGGIVNETDLYTALVSDQLSGAAVDVFEEEPYQGPLASLQRCLLTAHMGSMSGDCRARMEYEATEEVVRFATGQMLKNRVPEEEYENQQ